MYSVLWTPVQIQSRCAQTQTWRLPSVHAHRHVRAGADNDMGAHRGTCRHRFVCGDLWRIDVHTGTCLHGPRQESGHTHTDAGMDLDTDAHTCRCRCQYGYRQGYRRRHTFTHRRASTQLCTLMCACISPHELARMRHALNSCSIRVRLCASAGYCHVTQGVFQASTSLRMPVLQSASGSSVLFRRASRRSNRAGGRSIVVTDQSSIS